MKKVNYTLSAFKDLQRLRSQAARIMSKVSAYAENGEGKATELVGQSGKRLRVGDFRVIFVETDDEIVVTKVGPRGSIYDQESSMTHQIITTPAGERLAILPAAELAALQDALDAAEAAIAMGAIKRGEMETLTSEEVIAGLAAPTPLAFWREKRGMTQKQLGLAAGIGQSYIAGLEKGVRRGDPALFKRLAAALKVKMEDIVAD